MQYYKGNRIKSRGNTDMLIKAEGPLYKRFRANGRTVVEGGQAKTWGDRSSAEETLRSFCVSGQKLIASPSSFIQLLQIIATDLITPPSFLPSILSLCRSMWRKGRAEKDNWKERINLLELSSTVVEPRSYMNVCFSCFLVWILAFAGKFGPSTLNQENTEDLCNIYQLWSLTVV